MNIKSFLASNRLVQVHVGIERLFLQVRALLNRFRIGVRHLKLH
jgi:hypothetical protein